MIEQGARLEARDEQGRTPLFVAAERTSWPSPVMGLLLSKGANPNATNAAGETPLHHAARRSAQEEVSILLAHGATRAATNLLGQTPFALASGAPFPGAARLLAPVGVATDLFDVIRSGDTQALRALLLADPSLAGVRAVMGESPLHAAASLGATQMVSLILQFKPELTATNHSGWTPLYLAAWVGRHAAANLLADAGAPMDPATAAMLGRTAWLEAALDHDPSLVRSNLPGGTLLHFASRFGQTDTVRLLLDRGADPLAYAGSGRTPLRTAAENGHAETVALLRRRGADQDLWGTAALDDLADVRRLVEERPDRLQMKSPDGLTLLHVAAAYGGTNTLGWLLDRGLPVDLAGPGGSSPLEHAIAWSQTNAIRLLLERGADPNPPDRKETTPLHEAAARGHAAIVELLLEHGADPQARDRLGRTPTERLRLFSRQSSIEEIIHLLDEAARKR